EIGQPARVAGGAMPARERLVDGLHALEDIDLRRHLVHALVAIAVRDSERDLGERVEHIELRHRQTGQPVDAYGVTHDRRVEPPTAARAPGGGAELAAHLAQLRTL